MIVVSFDLYGCILHRHGESKHKEDAMKAKVLKSRLLCMMMSFMLISGMVPDMGLTVLAAEDEAYETADDEALNSGAEEEPAAEAETEAVSFDDEEEDASPEEESGDEAEAKGSEDDPDKDVAEEENQEMTEEAEEAAEEAEEECADKEAETAAKEAEEPEEVRDEEAGADGEDEITKYPVWINGVQLDSSMKSSAVSVTYSIDLTNDHTATYYPDGNRLVFNDLSGLSKTYEFHEEEGDVAKSAFIYATEDLNIIGTGGSLELDYSPGSALENVTYGIMCKGDLSILGASLDISGNIHYPIACEGDLLIDENPYDDSFHADIDIQSNNAFYGIWCKNGTVSLSDGSLSIKGRGTVEYGGIKADKGVVIDGAEVELTSLKGPNCSCIEVREGDISVRSGKLSVNALGDTPSIFNIESGRLVIGDTVGITYPAGGKLSDDEKTITDQNGNAAAKAVIEDRGYDLWIGSTHVTLANKDDILKGKGATGRVSYDPEAKVLTFDNGDMPVTGIEGCTTKTGHERTIYWGESASVLTIRGKAELGGKEIGIFSDVADITIDGADSEITVKMDETAQLTTGIEVKKLRISGGATLNVKARIPVTVDDLYVRNGTLNAEGIRYGINIKSSGALTVGDEDYSSAGYVYASNSDDKYAAININGSGAVYAGELFARAGGKESFGIKSKNDLELMGGMISITAEAEGGKAAEITDGRIVLGNRLSFVSTDTEDGTVLSADEKTFENENGMPAKKVTLEEKGSGEKYGLWIGNTQVTALNRDHLLGDKAVYDPDRKTLSLSGDQVIGFFHEGAAIYAAGDLIITASEPSTISLDSKCSLDGAGWVVRTAGDLTIRGKVSINAVIPEKQSTAPEGISGANVILGGEASDVIGITISRYNGTAVYCEKGRVTVSEGTIRVSTSGYGTAVRAGGGIGFAEGYGILEPEAARAVYEEPFWKIRYEAGGKQIDANGIMTGVNKDPVVIPSASALDPVPEINEDTTELWLVKGQKFNIGTDWELDSADKASKSVITLSRKGDLKAKKEGTATIWHKTGGIKQPCTVHVIAPAIKTETKKLKLTFVEGDKFEGNNKIELVIPEEYAGFYPVYWYSASPDVAAVDEDGTVTPIAKGTAKITAYVNGSAYTATVTVKESKPVFHRTIHLNTEAKKTVSIKKMSVWTLTDGTAASADKKKIVAGKTAGEAGFTTSANGVTYTLDVIVDDITLSDNEGLLAKERGANKYKLALKSGAVNVTKLKFASVDQAVVFKSSKPGVVFVDEDGNVTSRAAGKAKLTTKINGKTVSINVEVE